jgi:lysosomal Pro-X carboxypeptidase
LNNSSELTDYLAGIYMAAAQYDAPPSYPVTMVCKSIDEPSFGNDILGRIFAGMVAYQGELPCYVNEPTKETETDVGWSWQVISVRE